MVRVHPVQLIINKTTYLKIMSNKKKEQLGMNPSTASNRLRKMIMFDLVKRLDLDFCHQCGEKISNIDNFSIEHKEPWLDSENPKNLYFDLNNISFSHLKCNCKSRRNGKSKRGSSGYIGVYLSNAKRLKNNRWKAEISIKNKNIFLGNYDTKIEAAKVYDSYIIHNNLKRPLNFNYSN